MNKLKRIEQGLSRRPNWPQGRTDTYNAHSRPIRPLPKRRLRSRLSEEVRATLFAPAPTNPTRLFQLPYPPYPDVFSVNTVPRPVLEVSTGVHTEHTDCLQDSSDDEDLSSTTGNNGSNGTGPGSVSEPPWATGVGGSQMESYDWVENTNNKKKRKIPSPANPTAILGTSSGAGNGNMSVGLQSSGFSPNGSNTTPRSRWKASGAAQRSPLTISSGCHSIRRTPRRYPTSPLDSRRSSSRLFPQAGSDDTQSTTSSQNETHHYTGDTVIHQSQFTFEHLTPASHHLARQAAFPPTPSRDYSKTMSTVGTQTSPSISASNAYPPTPTPQKKKSGKGKQLQQRQRRPGGGLYGVQPNPNGEIWVCEFCEYESIFGERPEALLRQYDLKERRERRRLREKQRLLDKAKQKGKKNQGKSKKNAASYTQPPAGTPPPTATDYQDSVPSTSTTSVQKPRRNSQQVQTDAEVAANQHVSTGRGAGGSGGVGGGGGKAGAAGQHAVSGAGGGVA